ncbi:MAG: cupin domain-containing protein [Ignavibacteriales bacterium]
MSNKYIKNIDFATVLPLADQVSCQPGQIVSKTLAQNGSLSLTLFAFGKGEEISSHESNGDAFVIALDGVGEITVGDKKFTLHAGEAIVMPSKIPHAVYAAEQFKMFLVVVFS